MLPFAKQRMVGPFIFFDHFGPAEFARGIPRTVDVRPHPHIGLSTVTYLFEGEIMHRDSVGSEQAVRPGEVNWMVAGRGITHSERFEKARAEGGPMHGIQAWVALPREDEETAPSFRQLRGRRASDDGGAGRVAPHGRWRVARQCEPRRQRIRRCSTPTSADARCDDFVAERILRARGVCRLRQRRGGRAATSAAGRCSFSSQPVMRSFAPTQTRSLMILGGEPVGERYIEWNFVSSSKERIEQAKADWRAGRMKLPDLDHDEFIPLPPDPPPPANPMS